MAADITEITGTQPLFKRGDNVAIINRTLGGRYLVEGRAKIVRQLDVEGRYLVRFDDGDLVERCVDPAAQADPYEIVRRLNGLPPCFRADRRCPCVEACSTVRCCADDPGFERALEALAAFG